MQEAGAAFLPCLPDRGGKVYAAGPRSNAYKTYLCLNRLAFVTALTFLAVMASNCQNVQGVGAGLRGEAARQRSAYLT